MNITYRQLFFLLLFNSLFLFLIILGESYLRLYLFGLISLLYLFFNKELDFKKVYTHRIFFISWFVFLLSLFISSLFTHSIPLTINSLSFFAFSFLTASFFLLVKNKFISRNTIVISILMQIFVVVTMSTIFLLLPSMGGKLLGMNLLYSTYGHNHIAALLLIAIPLSWWIVINHKVDNSILSKIYILLPVFLTISLLLTFGRVAILISFLFYIFLIIFIHKNNLSFIKNKPYVYVVYLLTFLLFLIVIAKLILSTSFLLVPGYKCEMPIFNNQICKSFSEEARPLYLKQSLISIKNHPVFGYGPGTYSLLSKKYKLLTWSSTGYAHNAYLQVSAESGLVVGISFFVLMIYLLYKSHKVFTKEINKNNFSLSIAIFASVLSLYVNTIFDFDWSFIGIFSITLILISLLLKDGKNITYDSKFSYSVKLSMILISILLIVFSIVYLITDSLIISGRINNAYAFFPYFQSHMKIFSDDRELENNEKLFEIHKYNVSFYDDFLLSGDIELSSKDKNLYCSLDLWKCLNNLKRSDDEWMNEDLFIDIANYTLSVDSEFNDDLDTDITRTVADISIKMGNSYMYNNEYKKAGEYYLLSYKLYEWSLSDNEFIFDILKSNENMRNFIKPLDDIDGKYFGDNSEAYGGIYLRIIENELSKDEVDYYKVNNDLDKVNSIGKWLLDDLDKFELLEDYLEY